MVRGAKCDPDSYVFPGQSRGSSLSQMSMTMLLRRMKLGHYTVHGMRSSFRDYMGDMTHHAESTVEQALAHQVGDETSRAYRRDRKSTRLNSSNSCPPRIPASALQKKTKKIHVLTKHLA